MPSMCQPDGRTAILSFHSHGDRSFLDDRELALVSGDLSAQGFENDLVLTVLTGDAGHGASDAEQRLLACLREYDLIVYERVWSRELVAWLRESLPDIVFVSCRGEHELEDPPADFTLSGMLRESVPMMVAWLRGQASLPPPSMRVREGARFVAPPAVSTAAPTPVDYRPNLRPRLVNPEALPDARTFSLTGNTGCPYQQDARENPVYLGVEIPAGYGRGCAFCTTGNTYEAQPNAKTAAHVLEQIRYVRATAPELNALVLKDQNPFGYLTEVMAACVEEGIGEFSLLLETRGDWFIRSRKRFERALEMAGQAKIRICPFLIGIENFSQPELDRYTKGTTAEANIEFLETLWRWKEAYGDALDFSHAAFGFVLFSPWTRLSDLRLNLEGVRRTQFNRLRGSILHSRARLYPDTALYYLAKKDGLLTESFEEAEDNSKRYGYFPSHPWRFLHAETAHFASLAIELTERTGSRDQLWLFECLLTAFESAADFNDVRLEDVLSAYQSGQTGSAWEPVNEALRKRFEKLVQPLRFGEPFAQGWRLEELLRQSSTLELRVRHPQETELRVRIAPRGDGLKYRRSKHYDLSVRARELSPAQRQAMDAVCDAIVAND